MIDLLIIFLLLSYFFIAFRNPRAGLVFWVLISPFSTGPLFAMPYLVPDLSFDRMALCILTLGLISSNVAEGRISLKTNNLEKWMVLFVGVLAIELIVTYRPKDAASRFLSVCDSFTIPFVICYLTRLLLVENRNLDEKYLNNIVNACIIAALFISAMGIYEGISLNDLMPAPESRFSLTHGGGLRIEDGLARVNGPYYTPETYGVVLSMLFFIVLYKLNLPRQKDKMGRQAFLFLILIIIFIGIYYNMFRSIWLGLVLGLGCRFALMPNKRMKMTIIFVMIMATGGISWGVFHSKVLYNKRIAVEETFYSRVGAWLYCLRVFGESPIIGLGYGKLEKYIEHAEERGDVLYYKGVRGAIHAHNTFLSLLAENGIVGLIPFLFILWCIIRYLREYYLCANKNDDIEFIIAIVSLFVAYFVPMFFDKTGYYPKINNMFYLFIGITMAKLQTFRDQQE
jgi:O-antigen ligase